MFYAGGRIVKGGHHGDPVTSYDVTFFFECYHGVGQSLMKQQVAAVEIMDACTCGSS